MSKESGAKSLGSSFSSPSSSFSLGRYRPAADDNGRNWSGNSLNRWYRSIAGSPHTGLLVGWYVPPGTIWYCRP
ncbi:hypothetical protein BHE74_00049134 [Ensete ventricosum]|nr:hypothetical protein BHE74_00049134 [Ensete ventricosum]